MKFVDEFRDSHIAKVLAEKLQNYANREMNIMEVCGTHTMAIFKYGIKSILPEGVRLISGPGCPVCVTPQSYIDSALDLAARKEVIIATFGDMMRVPGKKGSLLQSKAAGADVRIVYSPMDAMTLAQNNGEKEVVFLSVGFETTTPMTAITTLEAKRKNIKNLTFLTANKVVPPVMEALVTDKELKIDGFLLPGHVSAIIGSRPYEFLSSKYNIPGVITGFEPLDILQGIYSLLEMIEFKKAQIKNDYKRIVKPEGNVIAIQELLKVFDIVDTRWRGIGVVPGSGYVFKKEFEEFDALKHFNIAYEEYDGSPGCRCGEILKGKITPLQCPLFRKICTPENPIGSCMVSTEGTCAAFYKYQD